MEERLPKEEIIVADNRVADLEFKRAIIRGLKSVKDAQSLSIQDIQKMVESSTNIHLGETTLYRVFAEDSEENDSFSYLRTLQPLEKALLVNNPSTADAVVRAQLDTYLHICQYKMEVIESLQRENDRLQTQIDIKDRRMDEQAKRIDKLLDKLLEKI